MNINDCIDYLKAHDGYLIVTHIRPDGDTLGCAAALCHTLRRMGKTAYILKNPELMRSYEAWIAPFHAPEDFAADGFADYGVLAGVEFQKKYEHLAYEAGNGKIPVQLFADYKANRVSTEFGSVKPNIRGGYQFANLNKCLPAYINDAIIEGILDYDRKLKGFSSGDAVLSGIESRTSSPVRIVRDETYRSDYAGLFPCGEGAGYAGGITSAAVDGIKVAEAVAAYINNIV